MKDFVKESTLMALNSVYPGWIAEYKFDCNRRFRADFAHPEQMILVEVEGAVFTQGRHTRGSGFIKDMEKYNLAVLLGYRLLRYTYKGDYIDSQAFLDVEKIRRY